MRPSRSFVLALALVSACANTPENRYLVLSPSPPAGPPAQSRAAAPLRVAAVRLPGLLDRPQLVIRTSAETVDIREYDRWAEPLDQMVPRVLAQDLALRTTSLGTGSERRLFVSIDEFATDTAGQSRLVGRWWVLTPGEDPDRRVERSFSLSVAAAGGQGDQVAAAMSLLVGQLADVIAVGA